MKAYKHDHWNLLLHSLVEIRHRGRAVRRGQVEAVMPDSSALWIAADGCLPRQMYDTASGYEAWVTPGELTGSITFRMTSDLLNGTTTHSRAVPPHHLDSGTGPAEGPKRDGPRHTRP